jgi:carotenoid cleavage dioxygenase-like enzyme
MRTRKFGCVSVDTKFVQTKCVQAQFEVDQDLGNWVFGSSPFLARRNQEFAACQKNSFGYLVLEDYRLLRFWDCSRKYNHE